MPTLPLKVLDHQYGKIVNLMLCFDRAVAVVSINIF